MGQKYEFDNVVAETLLIPLYMRAKESKRKKSFILKDELAEKLADEIDYDYSKFDTAKFSYVGCAVRGWFYDRIIQEFISSHTHPVVVNIGCGLDTRFQRIKEKSNALFYEMDLPEVIALRLKLIPEPEEDVYIGASLLDVDWMDELKNRHPDGSFIIIAEGVLMYFYEKQVKQFLNRIAERFEGGLLCFDVCGTMMTKHRIKPDSLRDSKAQIRSGINDGHIVEQWEPRLKLVKQASYMSFFRSRWGLLGIMMGIFPKLCYKFSSLLEYRIGTNTL